MIEKLEEKLTDLESNLAKWEQEVPECDLGVSLKMKVIDCLNRSIESLNCLILEQKKLE